MLKGTYLGVLIRICARCLAMEHGLRDFDQIVFGRSTTSRFEVVSTRLVNVDKWISEFGSTGEYWKEAEGGNKCISAFICSECKDLEKRRIPYISSSSSPRQ